jgi:hypothetical protein
MLDEKTRKLYRIVAWVSGLTCIAVILYGVASATVGASVGQNLVDVEFPLPYFAKPISYFSIASVAFFYCSARLWEERMSMWSKTTLSFLQLFSFVVAFASAYEVLYNFMLWGSIFSAQVISEGLKNANPSITVFGLPVTWNLTFATKVFSSLFVISGYSAYFLRRFRSEGTV